MKKIILVVFACLFLTGCGKYSEGNIIKSIENKLNKSNGYMLSGELSINNNDENYTYDVKVYYKKKDYYKVILTNNSNSHTQVILKNRDGVYVLTPLLNKSFKFQSDWPSNSQIYLINTLIKDIVNDSKRSFIKKDNSYIFNVKVNYSNNSKLNKEKIILDDKLNFKKAIVYNNDGIDVMNMKFNKINYNYKFSKDEFSLDSIIKDEEYEEVKETGVLDDIIYPLYIPNGTKLVNEDKIKKDNGERVIMNYDGEKSFLLVEETADVFNEFTIIPTMGEPYLLMDTLGVVSDNSLSWTSGGIDYYLISDVLSQNEMVEVAQSINGIVSMK